jgi:DNA-binding NarL/FixJ family response regulator
MPRAKTPEQKAAWAAYMREYRASRNAGPRDPRGNVPTERQIEILRAYAHPETGGSQRQVAEAFGISVSAVNNALQRLMRRLGVKEPAQAVYMLWVMEKENGLDGSTPEVPESR